MSSPFERQAHAVKDLPSRRAKGLKIERLLKLHELSRPLRVLDVGTGNGGIAQYFGFHEALQCDVTSVDVNDQRRLLDGYCFMQLPGTDLPFEDGSFDVVLSNHVIEHVGPAENQRAHVRELARVLAPGGVGYLAVPNRWMIVEPHFRLPFLSWLPRRMRSPYVRFMNKGAYYDCEPLTVPELDCLLGGVGLKFNHLHVEAIRETVAIEGGSLLARSVAKLPDSVLMGLRKITPTLIYAFRHPAS
ncbi:MAG: class I SAM-dependent methyltransferase [Zoogloeaceae bacterium]|nr:class I SAM-dependent methyltransferase [Zoogloeaceae bacterium]